MKEARFKKQEPMKFQTSILKVSGFGFSVFFVSCLLFLASFPTALAANGDFVRTSNYYLMSGSALESQATIATLSSFDLIVIPSEAQVYNKPFFSAVRKLNPDIIILAYVPTVSWNNAFWSDPLHAQMKRGIRPDWWLKDANGGRVSIWPNTTALDLNSGWTDYLAGFVKSSVMDTGLWDGIFYDEVQDRDDWKSGYAHLLAVTRSKLGSSAVIVTNGSSSASFTPYVNGRMFETFPSAGDPTSSWTSQAKDYLSLSSKVGHDAVIAVNVNTDNTGAQTNYRKMRFGLATTLLGDGYFGYDFGTQNHAQLWTYDEYSASLGAPKGSAEQTSNVWKREYEQGETVVNPTNVPQTVRLDGEYEKLRGTQDPATNNGSIVSKLTLAPQDGILLLRPLETIVDATYLNGSFAHVFSATGATKRNGFFAYERKAKGGTQVNSYDLDGDGRNETVVADSTYVTIYNADGTVHAKFAPYTESFKLGINLAIGDLEHDGSVEIVTGTENGGGPQIRIFNKNGNLINPGFFAYDTAFRGGVNVAIGDLNGDRVDEIIAGAGVGGGPQVRVFNKAGRLINPGFFAYDPAFRGGVNVAVGDVDGDGIGDIIAGAGKGGSPEIRTFDRDGKKKADFFAADASERNGVEVIAADIDKDGRAEIIGLSSDVFTMSFN